RRFLIRDMRVLSHCNHRPASKHEPDVRRSGRTSPVRARQSMAKGLRTYPDRWKTQANSRVRGIRFRSCAPSRKVQNLAATTKYPSFSHVPATKSSSVLDSFPKTTKITRLGERSTSRPSPKLPLSLRRGLP